MEITAKVEAAEGYYLKKNKIIKIADFQNDLIQISKFWVAVFNIQFIFMPLC